MNFDKALVFVEEQINYIGKTCFDGNGNNDHVDRAPDEASR